MLKKLFISFIIFLTIFLLAFAICFLVRFSEKPGSATFGVNFSQKHAQNLGLDWKDAYLALLDELKVKKIRLAVYWDLIEKKEGEYDFGDLDWQIEEAGKRGAEIILAMGMKTPRWPECHFPEWTVGLDKEKRQEKVLSLLQEIVLRYRDKDSIWVWQVENEPFFPFGECPPFDDDFLKEEINLVKLLDLGSKPILMSDSGEWSFWIKPAKLGDIVGVTMYKKVWVEQWGFYFNYFFPSVFYQRRAELIKRFFGKDVICVELQAEPWGPKLLYDIMPEEQKKTMDLERFKKNIEFARKTGLDTFYLWGGEWWYWMKEKQNQPEIWEEAKKLF
jgi:hypothetical protein